MAGVPKTIVGLWGEALAVEGLEFAGFSVVWSGGFTRGHDMTAVRGGKSWRVQVKCTTQIHGLIAWRGPGDRARTLNAASIVDGHAGAFFVLVHVQSAPPPSFTDGAIVIPKPTTSKVTGTDAVTFGARVDEARGVYGSTARQRVGRNSEPIGSMLNPDGLAYPVAVEQYDDLGVFVQALP